MKHKSITISEETDAKLLKVFYELIPDFNDF